VYATHESGLPGVAYAGESGLTRVAYTGESTKIFFSQELTGVGDTGESGFTGEGYIGESRLPGVAYTGESLVQPSRPAYALTVKEQFLKKQTVSVKYLLLGGDSRFENFSDLIPSD
jgi:hypothetical protein